MPEMVRKNKGHIVGIASMASFIAPAGIVDYAATKVAVLALHEGLLSSRSLQSGSDIDSLHRSQPRNQTRLEDSRRSQYRRPSVLGSHQPGWWLREAS